MNGMKERNIKKSNHYELLQVSLQESYWVLSFGDPLFGHTFSHSLCTQGLFHETVSVIGFLASEYSLAI